MTGPLASARQSSQTSGYPDSTKLAASVDLPDPAGPVNAQTPLGVATAVAWSASRPRRFTTSGSTWSIRRCLMVSRLWSLFALQQAIWLPELSTTKSAISGKDSTYPLPVLPERSHVAPPASRDRRYHRGSRRSAPKASAKNRANRRLTRRGPKCGKLRKRDVCDYSQPVGLLRKVWDLVLLRSATVRRRPENVQLKPPDLSRGRNTAASFPRGRKRP